MRGKLRAHRERFGELVDRLFARLRQSPKEITPKDVETHELRVALVDVVVSLIELPRPSPYEATGLRLVGEVHVEAVVDDDAASRHVTRARRKSHR